MQIPPEAYIMFNRSIHEAGHFAVAEYYGIPTHALTLDHVETANELLLFCSKQESLRRHVHTWLAGAAAERRFRRLRPPPPAIRALIPPHGGLTDLLHARELFESGVGDTGQERWESYRRECVRYLGLLVRDLWPGIVELAFRLMAKRELAPYDAWSILNEALPQKIRAKSRSIRGELDPDT